MKNYDSISADLFGYCDDYVKDCATSLIKEPNERIYSLSCAYIIGVITPAQREELIKFFLNR